MKLHLPCALRGALLACFALVCAVPAWAENDVTVAGSTLTVDGTATNPVFLKAIDDTEYTLNTSNAGAVTTLDALNLTNAEGSSKETRLIIEGGNAVGGGNLVINKIAVEDKKDLHIVIKSGTLVTIGNLNFTGKITYEIEAGAQLIISADDCGHNKKHTVNIIGSGIVALSGGTLDASKVTSPWFSSSSYDPTSLGPNGSNDIKDWFAPYLGAGSNVSFAMVAGSTLNVNGPGGTGGVLSQADFMLDWKGSGGAAKLQIDDPSVIIDPDTQVYRSGAAGNKVWNLHPCGSTEEVKVSVQQLQSGALGDINDAAYVAMEETDGLSFQGVVLTSSANATIGGTISVTEYDHDGDPDTPNEKYSVILDPSAGVTLTFKQGEGAFSGKTLELRGGDGSKIVLLDVTTADPNNIVFKNENTALAIGGPDELTLDASKNTFKTTSHLEKVDGGTLVYKALVDDTIGSLANASGTLSIESSDGNAFTLTAGDLTAGTLNVNNNTTLKVESIEGATSTGTITANTLNVGSGTATNISVTANAVRAGDVTLADAATLTVANMLRATGALTLGADARVNAETVSATDVTVNSNAALTGTLVSASGTTTVAENGSISAGNISISGVWGTASIEGMTLNGTTLTTTSARNTSVTTTGTATVSLGTTNVCTLITADGTTVTNTTISNSSIDATGNLTLRGVTMQSGLINVTGANATATLAGSVVQLGSVRAVDGGFSLEPGRGITVGGSAYTATTESNLVTIVGSATATNMTIDAIYVDLTGAGRDVPTPDGAPAPELLTASNGATITTGGNYFLDYVTEPGMVPYLNYDTPGKVTYVLRDESDDIIAALNTNDNASAVTDIISDFGMAGGTVAGKGELGELFNYLRDSSRSTLERRQAALNAIVSGSHTMMADSQRRNVYNTIDSLRNRVIQMGSVYDTEPETYVHAWIAAEGSNDEVDQDGAYAGYEYQTWGGSVGVHADVGNFSFGAAVTAAYGELTSSATDRAEGDHNAVAISAFIRHQAGPWTQMGILSLGRNEIEMERSVRAEKNPGKGDSTTYNGEGDSSGHTITAYYEGGYTITLDDEASQVLQPIVSLMLTSARTGEYHETGTIGNAGVCTPTEDYFYGTVGIGARYQIVLGTTSVDRISFAEVRAKLVQDFGDETNETSAYFAGAGNRSFTLRGAEVGRTGFQVGAGISVPTNVYTTLFADVDADFRSGGSSVSGSVGIRVEF